MENRELAPTERCELAKLIPVGISTDAKPSPIDRLLTWEQVRRVTQKNLRAMSIVFALVVLAVTSAAFLIHDVYQPTARVQIDPPGSGIKTLHEIEYASDIDSQEYLETQAQILKSDALAVAVIRALHLDRNPELVSKADLQKFGEPQTGSKQAAPKDATDDPYLQEQYSLANRTPLESIALDKFQRRLAVSPIRNSRLIEVSYTSRDPRMAQTVTNALVTQFIDQNYRNRYTSTMEASEWLSHQLNDLREKVQESNQAVADYQQRFGFVEADDRDVPLAQLMDDVNRQYSDAAANRIEAEAYVRMIDLGESNAIPAVRDDQLYQNLMTRFADARAQLAQARTIYGDDNSNVKKLENESNELAAQVEAERTRMVNQVRTAYAAALEREQLLQKSREKLRAQMGDASSHMVGYKVLKNEALATGELYNTLQARLKEAGIYAGLKSSNIRIVDLAPQLQKPTAPNRGLIIAAGSLLGCFMALAFCFVRESLDGTLRSPDDIRESTGLTSLAMIPKVTEGSPSATIVSNALSSIAQPPHSMNGGPAPRIFSDESHSAECEAMRDLRAGLMLMRSGAPPRVILVSSPSSSEGKTTVAINLAIALARRAPTCLVDADLRRPMVAKAFGVRPVLGLSDVLSGQSTVEHTLTPAPRVTGLSLLCSGQAPPNPGDLVTSDRMKSAVGALREKFEFVVIDSPPVIPVSDARVISPLSDVVVLVGRYESTTRRALARSAQLLSDARASVMGVVLNDIDYSSADYRYFNYGSGRNSSEGLYEPANSALSSDDRRLGDEPPKKKGAHA
jgi:capsular exopolysaccharide synthesis family protein